MSVFAGLCATCRHMRPVRSRSGSLFRLCLLSREDPRFPRYPKLPVLQCSGYIEEDPEEDEGSGSVDDDSPGSEPGGCTGDSEEVRSELDSVSEGPASASAARPALRSAVAFPAHVPRSR